MVQSTYETWQSHPSDGTNELNRRAIMDVSIFDSELFRLRLVLIQQMNCKGTPLSLQSKELSHEYTMNLTFICHSPN